MIFLLNVRFCCFGPLLSVCPGELAGSNNIILYNIHICVLTQYSSLVMIPENNYLPISISLFLMYIMYLRKSLGTVAE